MAYRPDPSEFDRPLTETELRDFHHTLSSLSPNLVQGAYRQAHKECEMTGDLLPRAAALQRLVAAWKVMRRLKRRRPPRRD